LISISNTDPQQAIEEGQLREDLYYRIAYISLNMPPLRRRSDDLPILISHLIGKYNARLNLGVNSVSPELFARLEKYPWPGNVRELEHLLAAGMSSMRETDLKIGLTDLPPNIRHKFAAETAAQEESSSSNLELTMDRFERKVVEEALKRNSWNVSKTARELGLKRQSLQYRMKKYALHDS
jgi:arginine utilization regulatory protein